MSNPDQIIDQALAAEERDLLRRIGDDPGHVEQTLALFSGRAGWVSGVLMVVQAAMFVGGLWAGWRFLEAQDALTALHWGLPSAVLLIMALTIKLALWPVMQTNRVLLALKRLEVLLVRNREGRDGGTA